MDEILNQIRNEISLLQNNLQALNSIRAELEEARNLVREHITRIDEYIRSIQTHSTNLQNLFSRYADEIKDHTVREISRVISSFEAVANEVTRTINSLKDEIKNLLKTNNELAQQATKLFKQIDEINLPKRFNELDKSINEVKEKIIHFENNIEEKFKTLQTEIEVIHQSNAEIKKQNKLLIFFSTGISIATLTILILLLIKKGG